MKTGERARRIVAEVRPVVAPWLVTRVVVLAALAVARHVFSELGRGRRPDALAQGLFAWDGAFYRAIAESGYHRAGGSLRFFPLFPLVGRVLGDPFGHANVALVVVANVAGLGFLVLLARLVRFETHDEALARRTVWIASLVPSALTLVLAYAESTFVVLAVAVFLALRTRRWVWSAAGGFLAALCRPVGVLLAAPAALEAARGWREASGADRARRALPVIAPLAGTGAYLGWVGGGYGDWLLPLHIQTRRTLRGGFVDPVTGVAHAMGDVLHARRAGSGPHLVWAAVFLVLLVVVARRLPVSYTAFSGLTLVTALSARNLDSMERYALGAFPLLIGAGIAVRRPEVERVVEILLAAALVGYGVLVFLGRSVP